MYYCNVSQEVERSPVTHCTEATEINDWCIVFLRIEQSKAKHLLATDAREAGWTTAQSICFKSPDQGTSVTPSNTIPRHHAGYDRYMKASSFSQR